MDMSTIMRQAKEFQQKLGQVQNELSGKRVTGSAGGGKVAVTANGKNELVSIQIAREVINPDDQEMLQDMVMAAVNDAIRQAQEMAQAEMRKITGGINIPGMF